MKKNEQNYIIVDAEDIALLVSRKVDFALDESHKALIKAIVEKVNVRTPIATIRQELGIQFENFLERFDATQFAHPEVGRENLHIQSIAAITEQVVSWKQREITTQQNDAA